MPPEIEDILNQCIDRKRSGGDPEEILRANPQAAEQVRPLLALAGELEALPDVKPSAEGMTKLMTALATQAKPARPRVRLFSVPVLARAAALLLCVLFLGWGAAAASSNTVPGDWLYPIKLLTEKVQFFLAVGHEDQVELRIVFSDERLKEAVKKYQRGEGIDKELLKAMLDEAKVAVDGVPDVSSGTREVLVARVAYQAELQRRTLQGMKERANAVEREALAPYLEQCSNQCMTACRMMDALLGAKGAVIRCPMCQRSLGGEMNHGE